MEAINVDKLDFLALEFTRIAHTMTDEDWINESIENRIQRVIETFKMTRNHIEKDAELNPPAAKPQYRPLGR